MPMMKEKYLNDYINTDTWEFGKKRRRLNVSSFIWACVYVRNDLLRGNNTDLNANDKGKSMRYYVEIYACGNEEGREGRLNVFGTDEERGQKES